MNLLTFVLCLGLYFISALAHSDGLRKNLKYFEVIHRKDFGHHIVKRGVHPSSHPFNKIREVNFKVR